MYNNNDDNTQNLPNFNCTEFDSTVKIQIQQGTKSKSQSFYF